MKSELTREELELLALEDELCRREEVVTFRAFVEAAWHIVEPGVEFVPGMHIDAICAHLQAVADGLIRDLIINVPPRHTKSTLTCVLFPAWVWLRRPDLRFIYGSDSFTLSKRDSIKCRRLIESPWYRKRYNIAWRLANDQNEKMSFENTRTGSRLATSVGASVIGLGGDFLVVDDPSNAVDIYSETHRGNVITWYNEAFSTRANDPKTVARIVIMQRLHEEDLTGHLLEKGGWDHLVLPAEYEPPKAGKAPYATSIGWIDPRTELGALLWPDRFGPEELAKWKKNLGLLAAAGQLQQLPSAADGDIIKRDHIKFYASRPEDIEEVAIFGDLSFKDGPTNDFTCIEAWGRKGSSIYLLDQIRGRMSFPKQVAALEEMIRRWPEAMGKYIEEAANGAAIISTLEDKIMGIVPVKPRTSKEARLAAVSPMYEAGNVYYPDASIAPWVEVNLLEILGFPNAKHDDTVDVASMAVLHFGQVAASISRLEALTQ